MDGAMKRSVALAALLLTWGALLAAAGSDEAASAPGPRSGSFSVLTYNVAGLPEGISQSHPVIFMKKISERLNAFDLVLAQEDFNYEAELRSRDKHPYYSGRSRAGIFGDGLARFSNFPLGRVTHLAWTACYGTFGHANDCLTPKGFSYATHEIAPGVFIDVYNLHMDAGGSGKDNAARSAEMDQLIATMSRVSAGKAVIIGGDWNLAGKRRADLAVLARIIAAEGLADSCRTLGCGRERIDRIMFRGNDHLKLWPVAYKVEKKRFSTRHGLPLSDHQAVSVVFKWESK